MSNETSTTPGISSLSQISTGRNHHQRDHRAVCQNGHIRFAVGQVKKCRENAVCFVL